MPEATIKVSSPHRNLPNKVDSTPSKGNDKAGGNEDDVTPAPAAGDPSDLFSSGPYYFDSTEVDTMATPIAEWSIDTENIKLGELIVLRLKIYFSNAGRIDRYDIQSSTADESKTTALLQTIELTTFAPALIRGAAVPSVQEIEITIDTQMNQQDRSR